MDATEQRAAELEILNGVGAAVHEAANNVGMTAEFYRHGSTWSVTVGRPKSDDPRDWSMEPVSIAIGPTLTDVSTKAVEAIKKMQPRLQRALDAASPYPETVTAEDRIAVALERIADVLERVAPPVQEPHSGIEIPTGEALVDAYRERHAATLARRSAPDSAGAGETSTDGGADS